MRYPASNPGYRRTMTAAVVHSRPTLPAAAASRPTVTAAAESPPVLPGAGSAPAQTGAGTQRDALIDNARFALIVLVVLGHLLASMRGTPLMNVAYAWIYMFHMPAFVFLSGLVIFSTSFGPRQGGRVLTGLLAPLLIFTALYQLVGALLGQPAPFDDHLMNPYWLLWFLAALALWRMSAPLLGALRWPVPTTVAVATALALLADLPAMWSIDRFVVLMPFFAAGLFLTPQHLQALRTTPWRLAAAVMLVMSVPIALYVADALPDAFITFTDGVESIGDVPEFLGLYAIAAAMIVALLALWPSGHSRMTVWGTRTIYVYLLHGFLIRALRSSEYSAGPQGFVGLAGMTALALAVSIALSSDTVTRWFKPVVEPRLDWLLRPAPATPMGPVQPSGSGRSASFAMAPAR